MDEVSLDPDGAAVKAFIEYAVTENLDSPTAYAFEESNGWPVEMSQLEADEVAQVVQETQPHLTIPHSEEHKERAIRAIRQAQRESNQRRE